MSMTFDEIASLKVGDVLFECQYGANISARVVIEPVAGTGYEGRRTLAWKAENTEDGTPVLSKIWGNYSPSTQTRITPRRVSASLAKLPLLRSMPRPRRAKPPRSVIVTTTDRLPWVTRALDPRGSVFDAAVMAHMLNRRPLAMRLP